MTNEEIFNKIKQYESKWGKLGHTNIMNPEKNTIYHSGINKDISQGGNKTMSRLDNELYKFRQKVAAGKEANKLAHKSYISPDELNKMNYDQLMNSHTLIHAANPMKGQQRENVKYYRREGQPGNYTYYYTKEEWDNRGANNAHSNAQDQATKEASKRWLHEGTKKYGKSDNANWVREMNANEKGKQMDRDIKYVDSLKKDISEGVGDVLHDRKNPVGKLMDYIEDAFDDGELRMDEKGNMSGDEKVIAKIQEMSKEAEDYGKNLGSNLGEEGSKKVWNEFQKQTGDRISKLTKTYNVKDEAVKIFDEKGEDGIADYLLKTDEWKNMEKEVRKLIGEGKLRLNRDNSGFNNISKEKESELDNLYEQIEDYIDVIGDGTGINKSAIRKMLNNELTNLAASHSETKYETNSNGKDNYNTGDKKFANTNKETDEYQSAKLRKIIKDEDRKRENSSKNNGSRSLTGKDNNPERDRYAKHSSDDSKALITNSNMGDEIMDEYSVFQEKVKRGKEMNRIAHSTFISPSDLNARYEKDLEKEGILVHAGNYKYYNKIDLPNGTTRYFYTKAEWDAYQDGMEQSKKASSTGGANLKTKNASMYEDLAKKAHEKENLEKQQKDTFEKNKAAEEAQKKAESDKWNTHKKIREDFHQVPGYMSYSSRFTDTMKETPEGSKEGKDYLFNVMYDAYKKYPKMKNIRTISSNQKDKPKDEEVFGFMDEIQKGIDKYTSDFINKYQLPKEEYTPLINNYFLSMANDLMKENTLDYNYISDVYYRNSDVGKKETKAQEILKQGDFRDHVFPEQLQNGNMIEGLNRSTGQELIEKTENSETYKNIDRDTDEEYQGALKSFAQTRQAQYIKEEYNNLKNRRTNDGKQQYSDEDIYNAIYKFLHRNVQQWAVNQDDFNPNLSYLIPDLLKTMGIDGKYTADMNDLIIKAK